MRVTLLEASNLLRTGQVVAVPTETVYGLAASLAHPSAIKQIFTLKGRPSSNPLIMHVAHPSQIALFAKEFGSDLNKLAETFWPGPLTLVIPIKSEVVPEAVRANLPTAAFRIPNHPLTRELLNLTGPLVMPSANLSGKPSSTTIEHVEHDFGRDFPVLDGGACLQGLESTILYQDKEEWKIIRQGTLTPKDFKSVLGYEPQIEKPKDETKPLCPGQLFKHYAPAAKLTLTKNFQPDWKDPVLGYQGRKYPDGCKPYLLGDLSSPESVGHNFYTILRQLDQDGVSKAYVDIDFPDEGILSTVLERLRKAAGV